jgi:hypothetical protein
MIVTDYLIPLAVVTWVVLAALLANTRWNWRDRPQYVDEPSHAELRAPLDPDRTVAIGKYRASRKLPGDRLK